jgi:phenylacetate-CoA ligase
MACQQIRLARFLLFSGGEEVKLVLAARPYWQPDLETMPRASIEALQTDRLQAQVARVMGSPFYRRHWQGRVTPDSIQSRSDVVRLPFLYKQDLLEAQLGEPPLGDLSLTTSDHHREIYPVNAARGIVYTAYEPDDIARTAAIGARILWGASLRPGELVHNGFSYGLFAGGIFVHRAARELGAAIVPIGTDSVKRQVEMLFNFKPAMIVGAPSHVSYLAERIAERGLSPREVGLKAGLFGGEPGAAAAATRSRLEQLFGCKAFDLYGITEVSALLAGECAYQQGLHWAEDHVMVEVINPVTLEPCHPGEQGVLVLTDLTRRSMPLLRYWTGDMATLVTDPCPCGRTHARSLGGIRGRSDELIIYRGAKFYPSQVARMLTGLAQNFQIRLERDPDSLYDQATLLVEVPHAPAELIAERLREELGADFQIRSVPFGALERSPSSQRMVEDRRQSP